MSNILHKYIQGIKDFFNFFKFKKDIKREFYTRDSKFNQLNLKKNWLGDVIYVQLNCTDEDLMNASYDSERMVMIKLQPIVNYLSQDLDWGDYLTPQIANFVDEDNNPSLSYGIMFIYTPIELSRTMIIFNFICTVIGVVGIIGASILCLV